MIANDLERFYGLLAELRARPGQGRRLGEYTGSSEWPGRGVYFFFEPGECRSSRPDLPRVVRVGTHALGANSRSTLWGRLRTHRGAGDGRGNHRGSVFRLHVGAALLRRDGQEAELPTWGRGQSAPREVREREATHERRVSEHIREMPILWVDVPDEPGPQSQRGYLERNAIALLCNHLRPIDPPGVGWLGLHSPQPAIRESGLWNVNHVDDEYDRTFLDAFEELVHRSHDHPGPSAGPLRPHLVLLGDSIFDNSAYVGSGPALIDQVPMSLPDRWDVTLAAVDGSAAADVPGQLVRLRRPATHLVVSAGGNDAIGVSDILEVPAAHVGEAMLALAEAAEAFEVRYRAMLREVLRAGVPTAVCTVYWPRFSQPDFQRMCVTALTVFNDAILRAAADADIPVLDLRRICTEDADYANEIEPSSAGGRKIADAIGRLAGADAAAWRRAEIRV